MTLDIITKNSLINLFFEGLSRWDAQHYLYIARFGYTKEDCLAFFPLFPLTLRILANQIQKFFNFNYVNLSMIISGVVLNNVIFYFNKIIF